MKFGWLLALATLLAAGSALAQDTTSDKGKLSYAIGFQIGSGLADRKMDVDIATVSRAIQDAFTKKPPAVPEAAMKEALSKFEQKAKADMDKTLADNKRDGDAFMAANRAKKGVIVLPGDVQYRVIEEGSGKPVTPASEVTFHVRVSLIERPRAPELVRRRAGEGEGRRHEQDVRPEGARCRAEDEGWRSLDDLPAARRRTPAIRCSCWKSRSST